MYRTNPILTDADLNGRLRNDGYVVVSVLDENLVKALVDVWGKYHDSKLTGFHTTHFLSDREVKRMVHHSICEAAAPLIYRITNNYQAIFANFMVKAAYGDSPVPLHADWSYVNEREHVGLSMWIPLIDTDKRNGCLSVIPGSHRLSYHIRGPRIPQWDVPCNFELIEALGKPLTVNLGDVVIYDHRLLHYSDSNKSGIARPAVNISLVPAGTPLFHYTIPQGEIDIHAYAVEHPEFFLEYDNFCVPNLGRLLWKRPNNCPLLDESCQSFIEAEMRNRKGLTDRMWSWLRLTKTTVS